MARSRFPDFSSESAALRVAVVSDDALGRAGLAALLGGQPGIVVVAQAASGELLDPGSEGGWAGEAEVVAWDLGAAPEEEWALLAERAASGPPVLALLPDGERAAQALAAGARGALLRDADPACLAMAVRALAAGLLVLDDAAAAQATRRRTDTGDPPAEAFTSRELEVLGLLAQGLPNRAIARSLGISEHTAKFHVNSILAKLEAHGRTEAVVRAARLGLIVL
jgi:DNA-binding NarL/FixJ family response regulator